MLFDEPTSALDEQSRNKVAETIKNIHGKTILLVTHDMSILSIVDSILVLHEHKLVPVEELGGLEVYRKQLQQQEAEQGSENAPEPFSDEVPPTETNEEVQSPEQSEPSERGPINEPAASDATQEEPPQVQPYQPPEREQHESPTIPEEPQEPTPLPEPSSPDEGEISLH
jgi:ABC-type multidrug transport system ATPase subunit